MNATRSFISKRMSRWIRWLLIASLLLTPTSATLAQSDEPLPPPDGVSSDSVGSVEQADLLDAAVPTGIAPLAPLSEDPGYPTGQLWSRSQEYDAQPVLTNSDAVTPTGQVSGEASPGIVELDGPAPAPQQPVDPA